MVTREELQRQVVKDIEINGRLAICWATSVGKSKAAINIINYLADKKFKDTGESLSVLLLVAERAHMSNWALEFTKFSIKTEDIDVACYASLKKCGGYYDLVIMDEAHNVTSDLRLSYLVDVKAENYLLLSATLSSEDLFNISEVTGKLPFTVSRVTLQSAINNSILPEPKIHLIPLVLNNSTNTETIVIGKSKSKVIRCNYENRWKYLKNKKIYKDTTLIFDCTQQQKYNDLTSTFNYFYSLSKGSTRYTNLFLRAGLNRKKYLGEIKTPIVSKFLKESFNYNRFIVFCSSVNQAKTLGRDNAIHSSKEDSLTIIDKFNAKEINSLFAVKMLREGQNLKDIEAEVIVQLDGSERPFIQEFGRVMRADAPVLYIFYYPNTRDEEYLNKDLEHINPHYVKKHEIYNRHKSP